MLATERDLGTPGLSALVVAGIGLGLYLWWDNWWISWDGGTYLYLGQSLREGRGLTFPDGSAAMFRGPGYPGLFALAWTVLDVSAKTAIWVSRAVLIAGGALIAGWISRVGARMTAGIVSGLIAVVPALVLEAGAWYLVPDGAAAVAVVISVVFLLATRRPDSIVTWVVAGVIFGLAFLIKETSIVYAPIPMAVAWARVGRGWPREAGAYLLGLGPVVLGWMLWTVVVDSPQEFLPGSPLVMLGGLGLLIVVGALLARTGGQSTTPSVESVWSVGLVGLVVVLGLSLATLLALGEPTTGSLAEGAARAADEMAFLLGWSWLPALILLVLGLWAGRLLPPDLAPTWLAGALLIGGGLGQALYAGAASLLMRNAVATVLGLALIVGTVLGTGRESVPRISTRTLGLLLALAFLVTSAVATTEVDRLDRGHHASWENAAVVELNNWLVESELTEVTLTPFYATTTWLLGGDLPQPSLLDMHFASAGRELYSAEDFCHRVWWGGSVEGCPADATIAVADVDARTVAAVFTDSLDIEGEVLVITGNAALGSPFGGAGLLYLIESQGLGRRVFATSEQNLPHWAVAYEMDAEAVADWTGPSVLQRGVVGVESMMDETVLLDNHTYSSLLTEILP